MYRELVFFVSHDLEDSHWCYESFLFPLDSCCPLSWSMVGLVPLSPAEKEDKTVTSGTAISEIDIRSNGWCCKEEQGLKNTDELVLTAELKK